MSGIDCVWVHAVCAGVGGGGWGEGNAPAGAAAVTLSIPKPDPKAAPGSQFILSRISPLQATEQLKHALVVTENAKQSNVIKVAMQGANPQLMSRILGEIVNEYLRQRSAEQLGEANELVASYDRQLEEAKEAVRVIEDRAVFGKVVVTP